MRTLIVGYGIQGKKRRHVVGADVVGIVDSVAPEANFRSLQAVPLDSFDVAMLCVPDAEKVPLLSYLLQHGKPTLVEKPLMFANDQEWQAVKKLSETTLCYTAYNHRFEPHFMAMRAALQSGDMGSVYAAHLFYGNGTARDVRQSPWRDQGLGVIKDLGSHLLDTALFWFGNTERRRFEVVAQHAYENQAPDHAVMQSEGSPYLHFTVTLLSWRNHFSADVWAEKGSLHIDSLCKWGPSRFIKRIRQLPSGKPSEEVDTLVQADVTWQREYAHFLSLIDQGKSNIDNDRWIQEQLT